MPPASRGWPKPSPAAKSAANTAWTGIFRSMENILFIRLKSIGDVFFTLPAVGALRENFPAAKITFLTSGKMPRCCAVFREVNEVIALDRAALRSGNPLQNGRGIFPAPAPVARREIFAGGGFSGLWRNRLAGTAYRRAAALGQRLWRRPQLGLHARSDARGHDPSGGVESCNCWPAAAWTASAVKNEFVLPADALAAARQIFRRPTTGPGRPTLFIQPFTSSAHKNWPLENFLAVARHWRRRGVQVIFVGGPADRGRAGAGPRGKFLRGRRPAAAGLRRPRATGRPHARRRHRPGPSGRGAGPACGDADAAPAPGACVPFQHPDGPSAAETPGRIREISAGNRAGRNRHGCSIHRPVMLLVKLQAEGFFQPQHPAVFFFARGQPMVRVGLKNSLRRRQPVLHDLRDACR